MATTKKTPVKKSSSSRTSGKGALRAPARKASGAAGGELLSGLNPQQLKAVQNVKGPQLVVAGAGSGKTRVLTRRIAYLVSKGAAPERILAVTFTNKAAREMASRVDALVGSYVPISTFHSFCLRVLRDNREALGMERGFAVYDQNDQLAVIKECMRRLNITDKHYKPQNFANKIGLAKDRLETAEKFAASASRRGESTVAEVYREYEKELKRGQALDFDDLIMQTVLLFKRKAEILNRYQAAFDYVLVDEFQDTNYAQYQLVKLLVKKHRNIFVVGDPDQSIYRFRGAEVGNLREFEQDFPEAAKTVLEENYRSTPEILAAANDVIAHNVNREEKILRTSNPGGVKVTGHQARSESDEADFVVATVKKLLRETPGLKRRDMVVFYRAHFLSRELEARFVAGGVPYKLVGDVGFYSRREIKDQLSYMRAALNPYDDVSLRRIINSPARGLGETTQETLANFAQTAGISFYEALQQQDRLPRFTDAVRRKLKKFLELLEELIEAQKKLPPSLFLDFILEKTEYIEKVCPGEDEEDEARKENIGELKNAIQEFEAAHEEEGATTEGFLNEVALTADIDKWNADTDCVTLMTIHNAKGLEFPVVFMVGLEEELFPHVKSSGTPDDLEEERRLCYVGMTRAKSRLYLTFALSRFVFNNRNDRDPSRFLSEISSSHIVMDQGSKRAKSRPAAAPVQTAAKLSVKPAATEEIGELTVGMRVIHAQFGEGTISSVLGEGEMARLTIDFDNLPTPKVLVAKYARLKPGK